MAHGHTGTINNPGSLKVSSGFQGLLGAMAIGGLGLFIAGMMADKNRAWASFVVNHFFFLGIAMGALFFVSIQYISQTMWSAPIRRVSEALTAYLPFGIVTFGMLFYGLHDIYHWTHPEYVAGDLVLEGKKAYLNQTFFIIRDSVALILWIIFAKKMIGNSLKQDETRDAALSERNKFLAPIFLMIFAISFTMVAFDQLMSLDAHWFSTMFGVYAFAGIFYSGLAATGIMLVFLRRRGMLTGIVNDNHLHDVGKFMFAFTVFWAYIGFSQFMLIWYANLPEETGYFIKRMSTPWMPLSIFLLVGKFLVPFFFLMRRSAKRTESILFYTGIFMLIAQYMDLVWIVQPEFFNEKGLHLGWIEIGTTVGFLGVFGFFLFRFLSKNNVVAIGDPRLADSVFHHHI